MVVKKGPKLQTVNDRDFLELLAETTDICEFDRKLNEAKNSKNRSTALSDITHSKNVDKTAECAKTSNKSVCNKEEWCLLSNYRFLAQASNYRPCGLNSSFHIAAITHRMLSVYENEVETDLHDFLTKEDLCIMSSHQNDEDQIYTLIFQPKYKIRPTAQLIRKKLNEYVNSDNMKFGVDISEDSDFFQDAWMKSNPFHVIGEQKKPDIKTTKSKKKKH